MSRIIRHLTPFVNRLAGVRYAATLAGYPDISPQYITGTRILNCAGFNCTTPQFNRERKKLELYRRYLQIPNL